jgi:hydroxypyruvate reductase 1
MLTQALRVQLTEDWGDTLFAALKKAGGHAFSNMAVGYNNVDVEAATRHGIAVGNTPVCLSSITSCILSCKKKNCSLSNGFNDFYWGPLQGVLTETTAELAASLTLAAARRVVEADDFMRAGKYEGWLPTLYGPPFLHGCTCASLRRLFSVGRELLIHVPCAGLWGIF